MSSAVTSISFRADLIRKYGRPGPRYTSYPTALHFNNELAEEELLLPWRDPATADKPLSLYIHLPFCESLCWFCGCTKVITRDKASADRYLDYLEKEMDLWLEVLPARRPLRQLHLGGGTPTFLCERQLHRLGEMILSRFQPDSDSEFGVEIDPRRLRKEQVEVLKEIGFNRASLGVQDHNLAVQQAVHRVQPKEQTWQAVEWLRGGGFQSINIDLIYGLPLQTVESFAETIVDIVKLRPDRIALFGYAHIPWMRPSQKIFEQRNILPNEEQRLAILEEANRLVLESGYQYIGMDHFALPGDSLALAQSRGELRRNFQGYSTGGDMDILALGMSGISQSGYTYHKNEKDLDAYYGALDQGKLSLSGGYRLSLDDSIRRAFIMELMCHLQVDYEYFGRKYQVDVPSYFKRELESLIPMSEDGLVEILPQRLQVTDVGRYLLRNVALHFDAYLQSDKNKYSRTV
jgi:oxygen-independent coproporphyrinogen-3 oxidase